MNTFFTYLRLVLYLNTLVSKCLKTVCFPQTFTSSQSQISTYLPSILSTALRPSSFSPKISRLYYTTEECNNVGFSWSRYCESLPGFKMLPERHFRGVYSVVTESEPNVVPRGSTTAWFFPPPPHLLRSLVTSTTYPVLQAS